MMNDAELLVKELLEGRGLYTLPFFEEHMINLIQPVNPRAFPGGSVGS